MKQRHTAKRIFERLGNEHGFTGGYTIVKGYVREHRRRRREMYVPLEHPRGDAQADFGEAWAVIGGVKQKVVKRHPGLRDKAKSTFRRHRKVCCEIATASRKARRRGSAAASEGATCERHGSAPCAAMAVRSRAAPVYGLALAAAIGGAMSWPS